MNNLRKIVSFLLTFVIVVTLCSCSNYNKNANIYFELYEIPKTLDPQTAETVSELITVRNIYEGLMRKNENGEIVLGVAKNYTYKNLKYTFYLKDNLLWSDESSLTAYDFEFALKRGVDPNTDAPFASRLYPIKNAREISKGKRSLNSLGVVAKDAQTLEITLDYFDEEFLNTLSSSIAMPCNQIFFKNSIGKYGLTREYTISNGSYYLSRWNQENFKIKLSKNPFYEGDFEARNGAVFLTRNDEETSLNLLQNDKVDASFIDCALNGNAKSSGLNTHNFENTCWVLTISNELPYNIRKSLVMLCGGKALQSKLKDGYRVADSLYPKDCLDESAKIDKLNLFNEEYGKTLYFDAVKLLKDKKFPSNSHLYYYDDGYFKDYITAIVGHWQNNLGAYVNIEQPDKPQQLQSQLLKQDKIMAIFPVSSPNNNIAEYIKKFGVDYKEQNLNEIQKKITKNYTIIPLAFSKTTICYGNGISSMVFDNENGYIDFSFVTKK